MKSKGMNFHGPIGIGNGCSQPYGRYRGSFGREHTSQVQTYFATNS